MEKLFTRLVPALVVLFLLSFCEKEFNGERPFVRLLTLAPNDISGSGITLHGQILDLSGAKIIDYGFIIDSKKIEPDVVKNPNALRFSLAQETAKVGAFSYRVESHTVKGVTYYVRAYVQQDNKVLVLGEEFSFVSQGGVAAPSFSDFSPTNVVPGDTLTLTGKDFTLGLPKLTAKVGGVTAQIIGKPTNTSLSIQVPAGVPTTGKIDLNVGTIALSSSKSYQRVPPVIVNLPRNARYGTSFFIECQNIGKLPLSNQVKIGEVECVILEQQKNGLLCKLDDSKAYPPDLRGAPLTVTVESLTTSRTIIVSPPVIASIAPTRGIAGDELAIICEGISNNPAITVVNLSGQEVWGNMISIQSASKLIRLKIPAFTDYPQELVVTIRSGQLMSNPVSYQLNPQLVGLSASQKNWNYAFNLGNKVYIGTPKVGTPFEGFEPSYIQTQLTPVNADFNQTFEYAIPLQNNQILALNKGTNGTGEGHLVNIQSNYTAQLGASVTNQIPLTAGTSGLGLTKGVLLQHNKLAYVYVGNGTQAFWEFSPITRQFKALAPIPSDNGSKPSELVFFDQGSKLIAIASYPGNNQAQVLEYIPAINTWNKRYQIPLNGLIANDGFAYKHQIEPGFFYILSFLGQDRFAFGNEEYLFESSVQVAYRKQQSTTKKSVFLINDNVIVVDDVSIYRTKLIIN